MADYTDENYWNARYHQADTNFDWYMTYGALKEVLVPLLTPTSKILVVGCGNSRMRSSRLSLV